MANSQSYPSLKARPDSERAIGPGAQFVCQGAKIVSTRGKQSICNRLIINGARAGTPLAKIHGIVSTTGPAPRKRILIVDDDPSIRYMLGRILVDEGYEALAAGNGCDGLKIMREKSVDLVLLDMKMPGMNGEETLKEMTGARAGLPVIMMTAYPRRQTEGGLAGASALLQKPLDFPILLEAIKKLLCAPEGSLK